MRAQALVSNSYSCSAPHRAKLSHAMSAATPGLQASSPAREAQSRADLHCTAAPLWSSYCRNKHRNPALLRAPCFCGSQESPCSPWNMTWVGSWSISSCSDPGQGWWSCQAGVPAATERLLFSCTLLMSLPAPLCPHNSSSGGKGRTKTPDKKKNKKTPNPTKQTTKQAHEPKQLKKAL